MRVIVFCAVVVAVCGFACAADEDPEFDSLLQDEFTELQHRLRRSAKNPKKSHEEPGTESPIKKKKNRRPCCGEDDSKILWSDGVKEIKQECFEQVRKAASAKSARKADELDGFIQGNRTKDEYTCIVQCIGQKKEVLDYMGNVNKDPMSAYVKNAFASEPWKAEIADKVLEKCLTDTQKSNEGDVSTDTGAVTSGRAVETKCNPNGITFVHCLWRETQLKCPADKTRNSRKCNRLRERLRLRETAAANGTARSFF